ncbi:uncharacterized protein LOC135167147 isoform X2 [Diachasmimorpha longicaudata]|uniref:uncharacterized protein LOC135167147 isoform X2 n=1 Tax=Diachasmimorpha longicaudata TaxID=58733 RepID=UPI0030B89C4A
MIMDQLWQTSGVFQMQPNEGSGEPLPYSFRERSSIRISLANVLRMEALKSIHNEFWSMARSQKCIRSDVRKRKILDFDISMVLVRKKANGIILSKTRTHCLLQALETPPETIQFIQKMIMMSGVSLSSQGNMHEAINIHLHSWHQGRKIMENMETTINCISD